MKLGLHINEMSWDAQNASLGATIGDVVEAAEAAGFDAVAFADHVWLSPWVGGPLGNHLEAYTALGYIAARTKRVRLLALATAASYRPAGLLAKIVTTLDVLSEGRAMLGIGSGDYPEEARGLGLPFPETATERFDVLEETVRACLEMWTGDRGSDRPFEGTHVLLERALNIPQAVTRPHPPILIAGSGPKRTLPLVARYADACNLPPSTELPAQLDRLRELCEAEGRDFASIERTAPFRFDVGEHGEKVGELIGQLRWLGGMGIQTVFGSVTGAERITPIEIMGREVIPAVAAI
jgi:alkanesulfonate monooxygenase SsuD/methylene tetrahydromethanopterin reductase-like flavin-dependent oxidoreductase (luciferase family)